MIVTPETFAVAIRAAKAGDVLILADGDYGPLTLRASHFRPVTLRAQTLHGARLGPVTLTGARGWSFSGLSLAGGIKAERGAGGLTVTDCRVTGTLSLRDLRGLVVVGNDISGARYACLLNSVQDFVLRGNVLHTCQEDLLRITGDSFNGLVEGNSFLDTASSGTMHPDAIQFFGAKGKTPRDIIIRGNHIWDDNATGRNPAQGIFVSDPDAGGYRNLLIEGNLICTNSPNSIYINGGQENVIVRGNVLMPGRGDGGAVIRLARKSGMDNSGTVVEGNTAKQILDETRASAIGVNTVYGRGADRSKLWSGDGRKPEDFVPAS